MFCYRSQETAETHARNHDNQERINESFYPGGPAYCQDTCPKEQHFHCVLVRVNNIILIWLMAYKYKIYIYYFLHIFAIEIQIFKNIDNKIIIINWNIILRNIKISISYYKSCLEREFYRKDVTRQYCHRNAVNISRVTTCLMGNTTRWTLYSDGSAADRPRTEWSKCGTTTQAGRLAIRRKRYLPVSNCPNRRSRDSNRKKRKCPLRPHW